MVCTVDACPSSAFQMCVGFSEGRACVVPTAKCMLSQEEFLHGLVGARRGRAA
jgi:hypothetical protein